MPMFWHCAEGSRTGGGRLPFLVPALGCLLNPAFPRMIHAMERGVYRILDVNYNRAREGARVIEEYCRFVLNSQSLTAQIKQIRHRISGAVKTIDSDLLLLSRESHKDVGRGMEVESQAGRSNLQDCFTAASKRLPEALRAMAEVSKVIDQQLAAQFEELRFEFYTLEKRIIQFASGMDAWNRVQLYVIITAEAGTGEQEIVRLTRDCVAGGADCVQLRCKGVSDRRALGIARSVVRVCEDEGVLSIINDRIDIALAAGSRGVHLGREDLPIESAKQLQTGPLLIGTSTHNMQELKDAVSEQPHYVGLGTVFVSETKPENDQAGLDYVRRALDELADSGIGHVAIGGISVKNIDLVLTAGARAIAVCSAVTRAADPGKECRKLKDRLEAWN